MKATFTVIDLTASLGFAALQRIAPAKAAGGSHRQIELAGLGRPARLDWLHLAADGRMPALPAGAIGVFILVGPGSARLRPKALEPTASAAVRERWALLAPNALIEHRRLSELDLAAQAAGAPAVRTLQLPRSDPECLWLILLEQFESLLARHLEELSRASQPLWETPDMSATLKESLDAAMMIEGALAVSLVDHRSGMSLGAQGSGLNLELAAAGNSEVVRAKLRTAESLGMRGSIEDILITLTQQYHLIRLIPSSPGLFLYLVLDRQRGNLALARYKLTEIERALKV